MSKVIEMLTTARRTSVPLVAVSTVDAWGFVKSVAAQPDEGWMSGPRFSWDVVRGLVALNQSDETKAALAKVGDVSETANPVSMLEAIAKLPGAQGNVGGGSLVLALNLGVFLHGLQSNPQVIQAVSNLREQFKRNRRMLVSVDPEVRLPAALLNDVVVLSEELPGDEEIRGRLFMLYDAVKIARPDDAFVSKAVDTVRGLSSFAVEQVFALSMKKSGLDLKLAWQHKEATINQTPGLNISQSKIAYENLGGLEAIKQRFRRKLTGRSPRHLAIHIDEIDKALAGVGGDMSGVSDDAYGVVLQWLEDNEHDMAILLGPGGTAKTAFAQAVAGEFELPLLRFDMGAMQAGIVGESQRNIRNAVKVANGICGHGGALIIATCNNFAAIPAPLQRRATAGIWYVDIPTREEQDAIWTINLKRFNLPLDSPRPECDDWTGAEIRNCCRAAWEENISLVEAARSIVPVAKSDATGLARLRELADGRFLSASQVGAYRRAVTVEDMPERALVAAVAEVELPKTAAQKGKGN